MLGNHGFERTFRAQCSRIFGAEHIKVDLRPALVFLLRFDQTSQLAYLLADAANPLFNAFKLKRELSPLAAKGLNLDIGIRDLAIQTPPLSIDSRQSLFRLRKLISLPRC